MTLNVEKFYNDLVVQYGSDYAAHYFDIWLNFWWSCGDVYHNYSDYYYRMFVQNY